MIRIVPCIVSALMVFSCGGNEEPTDDDDCGNMVVNCQVGCAQTEAGCRQTASKYKANCSSAKCVKTWEDKEVECEEDGEACQDACKKLCSSLLPFESPPNRPGRVPDAPRGSKPV